MERLLRTLQVMLMRFGPLELLYIVALAALARVTAFLMLPNSPSSLGPDEGTYAHLAEWVEQGLSVKGFPGYGDGLYNSARSLILPSVLIIRLGLEPLSAVRLTSLTYGVLSIFLFGKVLLRFSTKSDTQTFNFNKRIFILFVGVFAFLPSTFVWSILGLRESVSVFWILMSSYFLISLRRFRAVSPKDAKLASLLFRPLLATLSIVFAFGARRETALVFLVFFCTALILLTTGMRLLIATISVLGFIGGHLFTMSAVEVSTETQKPISSTSSSALNSALWQSTLRDLAILEYKRNINTVDARTALPITKCSEDTGPVLARIQCNLSELPYRLFSALFRPLPFYDTGSTVMNLASIENMAWLMLFAVFALGSSYLVINRVLLHLVLPTLAYVTGFACLFSLYEGNLGTAFRHKSTLLWTILLVIFLYVMIRKTEQSRLGEKSESHN